MPFNRMLDLSQDFSVHMPGFAGYGSPSVRWIKRLACDKAGGQGLQSTLHVATHLDAPAHFMTGASSLAIYRMHTLLFPHDVVHIENFGGDIDQVPDRKVQFGCVPWRFQRGEAAFCRAVVFEE